MSVVVNEKPPTPKPEFPGSVTASRKVIAYHGGNKPIRRFAYKYSAQGVFWFSEDRDKIVRGESGAASTKYIMKCELTVDKTAGWAEYDKYLLAQLKNWGYDSIKLDDDWVAFDSRRIKVLEVQQNEAKAAVVTAGSAELERLAQQIVAESRKVDAKEKYVRQIIKDDWLYGGHPPVHKLKLALTNYRKACDKLLSFDIPHKLRPNEKTSASNWARSIRAMMVPTVKDVKKLQNEIATKEPQDFLERFDILMGGFGEKVRKHAAKLAITNVMPEQSKLGPFTVIDRYGLSERKFAPWVDIIRRVIALFKRFGVDYLLYGQIELEQSSEEGSGSFWGQYCHRSDSVTLAVGNARKPNEMLGTLVHELGHRCWFKFMDAGQRDVFSAPWIDQKELVREAWENVREVLTVPVKEVEESWDLLVKHDFDYRPFDKWLSSSPERRLRWLVRLQRVYDGTIDGGKPYAKLRGKHPELNVIAFSNMAAWLERQRELAAWKSGDPEDDADNVERVNKRIAHRLEEHRKYEWFDELRGGEVSVKDVEKVYEQGTGWEKAPNTDVILDVLKLKPVEPSVSPYGNRNRKEDFAETFTAVLLGVNKDDAVKQRLQRALPKGRVLSSAQVTRDQAFQMFRRWVDRIWGSGSSGGPDTKKVKQNQVDKLVLKRSNTDPKGKVAASLTIMFPKAVKAIDDDLMVPSGLYVLNVSERLLEKPAEFVDKIMGHEALHVGYPRHDVNFRRLATRHGLPLTESWAEDPGWKVQRKEGARYKTLETFETEQQAREWALEERSRNPGKYRLIARTVRLERGLARSDMIHGSAVGEDWIGPFGQRYRIVEDTGDGWRVEIQHKSSDLQAEESWTFSKQQFERLKESLPLSRKARAVVDQRVITMDHPDATPHQKKFFELVKRILLGRLGKNDQLMQMHVKPAPFDEMSLRIRVKVPWSSDVQFVNVFFKGNRFAGGDMSGLKRYVRSKSKFLDMVRRWPEDSMAADRKVKDEQYRQIDERNRQLEEKFQKDAGYSLTEWFRLKRKIDDAETPQEKKRLFDEMDRLMTSARKNQDADAQAFWRFVDKAAAHFDTLPEWMFHREPVEAAPNLLYHGTRGPLAGAIMDKGLRQDSGFSNFGGQGGVSFTRDLKVAQQFGNFIVAVDPKRLKSAGYQLQDVQHPTAPNEAEVRVSKGKTVIPPSLFAKVLLVRPQKFEVKWWKQNRPDVQLEVLAESPSMPFKVGDLVLFGKYKNKKGKIVSFGKNPKGQVTVQIDPVQIDPVPKGRKKTKEMGLFKIWTTPDAIEAAPLEATAAVQDSYWLHIRTGAIEWVERGSRDFTFHMHHVVQNPERFGLKIREDDWWAGEYAPEEMAEYPPDVVEKILRQWIKVTEFHGFVNFTTADRLTKPALRAMQDFLTKMKATHKKITLMTEPSGKTVAEVSGKDFMTADSLRDLKAAYAAVLAANEPELYHTTSLGALGKILQSRTFKHRNVDNLFISFSERPYFGDISGSDAVIVLDATKVRNRVMPVEYTERWYDRYPEHAAYVAGEGWREQYFEPDVCYDDEGWADDECLEQAYREAELESFLYKSKEREWLSRAAGDLRLPAEAFKRIVVPKPKLAAVEALIEKLKLKIPVKVLREKGA